MDGILIINKPKGITSRDVVNRIVKILNTKKVGHTGTLDPLATGVLVVCVGDATKLVDEFTCNDKEYIATVELGTMTNTLDITGDILKDLDCIKTKEEIERALDSFIGIYDQEVPIYSAVKVNGKKLYEYARQGLDIKLPKRTVEIKEISLIGDITYINNKTVFKFKCTVSKGTYIRSLIKDISLKLNTVGIMTDLVRVRQGKFKIEDSINIEDVNKSKLIDIINVIDCKKVELNKDIEKKVLNGTKIYNDFNTEKILFTLNNSAVAIYKTDDNDNKFLKPYKMFKGGIK